MKYKKKLCPIGFARPEIVQCQEEKCAWWNIPANACAIHVLAGHGREENTGVEEREEQES